MTYISEKARQILCQSIAQHEGEPLILYRGEHGERAEGQKGFRTNLGSISFGSKRAATIYATNPNDGSLAGRDVINPIVHAVCLDIRNPLVCSLDPFVEMDDLIATFGLEEAAKYAIRYSEYVHSTSIWSEIEDVFGYQSVEQLYASSPHLLTRLYCNVYPLLDDPEFVELARQAGFDGAMYGGSGETALEAEFRVFSADQVINPKTGTVYIPVFSKDKTLRHEEGLGCS